MSIENSKVIDSINIDEEKKKILLIISDHLDWEDSELHLEKLQDKINYYIYFIKNNGIENQFPNFKNYKPSIYIVGKYKPNKTGEKFYLEISKILSMVNIDLEFNIHDTRRNI